MPPIFPGGHFTFDEIKCPDCGKAWPGLTTNPFYRESFAIVEDLRAAMQPAPPAAEMPFVVVPGGGARCLKYERKNHPEILLSPHSIWAIDVNLPTKNDVLRLVQIAHERYPDLRLGYRDYLAQGFNFVHIDRCYLLRPMAFGAENNFVQGVSW